MKLTRIDCNTGKVEIVDEFKLNSPLIYLCKIDEEHFLSYYVVKAPSKKNRICDINSRHNLFLLMEPRKKSSVKYMKTT